MEKNKKPENKTYEVIVTAEDLESFIKCKAHEVFIKKYGKVIGFNFSELSLMTDDGEGYDTEFMAHSIRAEI